MNENFKKALETIEHALVFDNEDIGNALSNLELVKKTIDNYEEEKIELNELKEFMRIVLSKGIDAPLIKEHPNITYVDYNMKSRFALGNYTKAEFDLIKKVVEKYGKKED